MALLKLSSWRWTCTHLTGPGGQTPLWWVMGLGEAERGPYSIERDGSEEAKAVNIRMMWEAYLVPRDVVSAGPRLLPRTMSEPVVLLSLQSMLVLMTPSTTKGMRMPGLGCHMWPPRCTRALLTQGLSDLNVLGCWGPWTHPGLSCSQESYLGQWPYCSQGLCWCPWRWLPLGVVWMPWVWAPPEVMLGPEGHQKRGWYWSEWPVLPLGAIVISQPGLPPRTMFRPVVLQQPGSWWCHSPCHHQGPQGCLGSGPPPVAMEATEGCAITEALTICVACIAPRDHGVD